MELITGINRVMAYTEQHLKEDLDCAKLAQLSGCSYADFQRVFSLLNHMSYLEYVKARRLSQAAVEIIHSRKRILDIALEYGYESADVFSQSLRLFTEPGQKTESAASAVSAEILCYHCARKYRNEI